MPCYHPIEAWYSSTVNPSGKRSLVFSPDKAIEPDVSINVPCGQCIGCRLDRSRQWAIRCMHEASLYEQNCFITLTFDDEHLMARDNPYTVQVRDYQLFMKRLRKKFVGRKIRFYHCGEYGERSMRPHYHSCLFNFDFPDRELFKITGAGSRLYRSAILEELWPFGFSTIGDVTFESAAYVARYISKKVNGSLRDVVRQDGTKVYEVICPETGEIISINPEYNTMSRRPGIAHDWYTQFRGDVYPTDFITVNGKKMRPPKYYDRLEELSRPYEFEFIKQDRIMNFDGTDSTPDRLAAREKVQLRKIEKLTRPVE